MKLFLYGEKCKIFDLGVFLHYILFYLIKLIIPTLDQTLSDATKIPALLYEGENLFFKTPKKSPADKSEITDYKLWSDAISGCETLHKKINKAVYGQGVSAKQAHANEMNYKDMGIDLQSQREKAKNDGRKSSKNSRNGSRDAKSSLVTAVPPGCEQTSWKQDSKKTTQYKAAPVDKAVEEYLNAISDATDRVNLLLAKISGDLVKPEHAAVQKFDSVLPITPLETVQFVANALIVSCVAHLHAEESLRRNWSSAVLREQEKKKITTVYSEEMIEDDKNSSTAESNDNSEFAIRGMRPYWMHDAVANDFEFQKKDGNMVLLTAPNAAGKSCTLRSVLAILLLSHCGFYAPFSAATSTSIPLFGNLLAFQPTGDSPLENLSAFESEVNQLRQIVESVNSHSFLVLDEFGRGTSAREASCLSGSVLELFDRMQCCGFFATHLHEMYELQLQTRNLQFARMENHKLLQGFCTNSEALACGVNLGLPEDLVSRARDLLEDRFKEDARDMFCRDFYEESTKSEEPTDISEELSSYDRTRRAVFPIQGKNAIPLANSNSASSKNDAESNSLSAFESALVVTKKEDTVQKNLMEIVKLIVDKGIEDNTNSAERSVSTAKSSKSKSLLKKPTVFLSSSKTAPPASLAASPCLYILILNADYKSRNFANVYIGESKAIKQRLNSHRLEKKYTAAVVAGVKSQDEAKKLETTLIRLFKVGIDRGSGFGLGQEFWSRVNLSSGHDGNKVH